MDDDAGATQVRRRLARAGLLDTVAELPGAAPDPGRVAAARARAGHGTSLAQLVSEGRD